MIAAILNILLVLIVKLVLDYHKWLEYKTVRHGEEWAIMAIFSTPALTLLSIHSSLHWAIALPMSALLIAWLIWNLFDGIYNLLRSFNWWFTGSNDKDDARTDNFLQGLKLWQHVAVKLIPLATLLFFYIKHIL